MTDLIDRLSGASTTMVPSRPKINLHAWIGMQRLYALNLITRPQVATEFDLLGHADEEHQATHIADTIDSKNTATNKSAYIAKVEAVFMCVNDERNKFYRNPDGTINKALVYTHAEIPPD